MIGIMSRRLASYGTVLILAVSLAAGSLIISPVLRARSIRDDIRAIQPGAFTRERLVEWAKDHGGTVSCREGRCSADVSIQNGMLYKLGLAPLTEFGASIITVGGKVSRTEIGLNDLAYRVGTNPQGATTSLVVDFAGDQLLPSKYAAAHLDQEPSGKPLGVTYTVSRSSDPQAVALAYDLNIWCLGRIGGCGAWQQAPRVWVLRR